MCSPLAARSSGAMQAVGISLWHKETLGAGGLRLPHRGDWHPSPPHLAQVGGSRPSPSSTEQLLPTAEPIASPVPRAYEVFPGDGLSPALK